VTVTRTPLERAEDEHVQRPLKEVEPVVVRPVGHSRRQSTALDVDCLRLVPCQAPPVFRYRLVLLPAALFGCVVDRLPRREECEPAP
jgi:hypothetical protein